MSRGNITGSSQLSSLSRSERSELRRKTFTVGGFALGLVGVRLRPYQLEAADAIIQSVFARDGQGFVIIFARQSGKDELIANLILFLLARLADHGGSIVCAQPTYKPQTLNAIDRLQTRAQNRPFFELGGLKRKDGYKFSFRRAQVAYLSAHPSANVVAHTADRLLIINEAQDVSPALFDKRFAPMAASGNATRVFVGTAWTSETLLERERQRALQPEHQDGRRRLFVVDGPHAAQSNPLYGRYLEREVLALGRDHPLMRSQYFCENIEARSRMFTEAHRLLMAPDAARLTSPPVLPERGEGQMGGTASSASEPHASIASPAATSRQEGQEGLTAAARPAETRRRYPRSSIASPQSSFSDPCAFLLDVAGQAEASSAPDLRSDAPFVSDSFPSRDSVTLRIVEIDLSSLPTLQAPTYRAVYLKQWTGENHLTVFGQIRALAENWRPQHIVMDATGVGEGLWAMLDRAFPARVTPVKFTQAVKSELGYGFLAIINSGRFRDCSPSPETDRQYAACECEILIGPQKTMRWGVPDGRRDVDGRLLHDDIPVTDSLTAILDRMQWQTHSPTIIVRPKDPLDEMSHFR